MLHSQENAHVVAEQPGWQSWFLQVVACDGYSPATEILLRVVEALLWIFACAADLNADPNIDCKDILLYALVNLKDGWRQILDLVFILEHWPASEERATPSQD